MIFLWVELLLALGTIVVLIIYSNREE
jgi:hypothetical protein